MLLSMHCVSDICHVSKTESQENTKMSLSIKHEAKTNEPANRQTGEPVLVAAKQDLQEQQ